MERICIRHLMRSQLEKGNKSLTINIWRNSLAISINNSIDSLSAFLIKGKKGHASVSINILIVYFI